jgi:hypothetical protein
MADYAARIASLKSDQARLARRHAELAAQRREEIGRLADKLAVLEAEDDVLAGLFIELNAAIKGDSPRLAQWRDAGLRFRSDKLPRQRQGANVAPHADGASKAASA